MDKTTQKTYALALSGGGYRATLYTLGSLWRLNEFGILKKLDRITAVSGGAITLGVLALNWNKLIFDDRGVATNFEKVIAKPLEKFCSQGLDIKAGFLGVLSPWKTTGDKLFEAYNERLFKHTLLKDIPSGVDVPEFIFYATNYGTGSSLRMTNKHIYDYKLGQAPTENITLAQAVASSSAFPPIFSPVILDSSKWKWEKTEHAFLHDNLALRNRLVLTDGGLYDNLGLEAIWKEDSLSNDNFDYVLVCDAGAPLKYGFDMKSGGLSSLIQRIGLKRNWVSQLFRMTNIMVEQQRALRKRKLVQNYIDKVYGGTYWGIMTKISDYKVDGKLASDNSKTEEMSKVPTRLNAFSVQRQGHLINWGYALTDAAIRCYVDPALEKSVKLPKVNYPL